MLVVLWVGLAMAGEPTNPEVEIHKGGAVIGTVELALPPVELRQHMTDPTWLARTVESETKIVVEGADGPCALVASESPSSVMTARYRTRRCPTQTGFVSTLRDSNCFDTYRAVWTFEPLDGGARTRAVYRIDLTTSLWVPNAVVRNSTRNGVKETLQKLLTWSRKRTGATP